MKILLTGAAGKIGSHTCCHLHAAGFDVRAVDRAHCRELPVRLEIVDLLEYESCYRLLEGMDAVVHLANHPNFHVGAVPQALFNENATVNMNVFQSACDLGVRKIVFASSVQTFSLRWSLPHRQTREGQAFPYLPVDGQVPARPLNPYGLSKQVSEEMLRYFVSVYGIAAFALRFPYVIDDAVVERHRERKAKTLGSPEEAFSYLHVTDAARLIEACLKADLTGYHQYFPVAQDTQVAAELPALLAQHYSGTPLRDGTPPAVLVDISEITRETGWKPLFNSLLPPADAP